MSSSSSAALAGEAEVTSRAERVLYTAEWLPPDFGAIGQFALIFACRAMARAMT